MTTKERFLRMYRHEEADRVPIIDSPWAGTIRRWENEGMPKGIDWTEFFDIDKTASIGIDITPRYEEKVLEETDEYRIYTTKWGVTQKSFKAMDSTPQFLDYKVVTPEAWAEAKSRMTSDQFQLAVYPAEAGEEGPCDFGKGIADPMGMAFDAGHIEDVAVFRIIETHGRMQCAVDDLLVHLVSGNAHHVVAAG